MSINCVAPVDSITCVLRLINPKNILDLICLANINYHVTDIIK